MTQFTGNHPRTTTDGTLCRRIVGIGLICMCVMAALPQSAAAGRVPASISVAVVKSLDLPEYNSALEGFIATLEEAGSTVTHATYLLSRDPEDAEKTCAQIRKSKPDLILTLGTRAAREISDREKEIPIVYAMVLETVDESAEEPFIQSQPNVTGATLNIPMGIQLSEMRNTFPDVKTVGIISDPSKTKAMAETARALGKKHGVEVRIAWAHSESEIPGALRQLRDSIDVLWMLPDATVLTPRSSRFVIFELIKSGVPVVGLSTAYVKAGALMALDCRYEDIGRQSGELAVQILAGEVPGTLPRTEPRSFTRAFNMKIREHIKISINESAVEDSNVVVY